MHLLVSFFSVEKAKGLREGQSIFSNRGLRFPEATQYALLHVNGSLNMAFFGDKLHEEPSGVYNGTEVGCSQWPQCAGGSANNLFTSGQIPFLPHAAEQTSGDAFNEVNTYVNDHPNILSLTNLELNPFR